MFSGLHCRGITIGLLLEESCECLPGTTVTAAGDWIDSHAVLHAAVTQFRPFLSVVPEQFVSVIQRCGQRVKQWPELVRMPERKLRHAKRQRGGAERIQELTVDPCQAARQPLCLQLLPLTDPQVRSFFVSFSRCSNPVHESS